MTAMAYRGWGNGSDRLRCGRQGNGLRDHLFDFRLVKSQRMRGHGFVWFVDIPQRRALAVRQLVLKALTGCFVLISGSCGPKHVGVLGPESRTQDAAVTSYRVALASMLSV